MHINIVKADKKNNTHIYLKNKNIKHIFNQKQKQKSQMATVKQVIDVQQSNKRKASR